MRRLAIFIGVGIIAVLTSVIIGKYFENGGLIIYLTYPNLLVAFLLFLVSVYKLHKEECSVTKLLPKSKAEWVAIAGITFFLLILEPFEFKIVYDEALMSVAAELIHFTRKVGFPVAGNDYSGNYEFLDIIVEKRPFFFPFIISLVHDLTGYRISNVYFLNAGLTVALVVMINHLGRYFGGTKGGILAVLLAGSLPLLAQLSSSGNLEVFNLLMLCLLVVYSYMYLEKPCGTRLLPLIFGLVLFFQIRYENGVYLLPFGLLIIMGWRKAGQPVLPWQAFTAPALMILPAIHYLIVSGNTDRYFQDGPNGRSSTFSLGYFNENIENAGAFLFSVDQVFMNSILLTLVGFSSCLLFIYYCLATGKRGRSQAPVASTVLLILFFAIILHLVLVFCFNFGMFNTYRTARLSLPLHLMLVLITPFSFKRFGHRAILTTLIFSALSLCLVFVNLPPQFVGTVGLQFLVAVVGFLAIGVYAWRRKKLSAMTSTSLITLAFILIVVMPVGHAHKISQRAEYNDTVMREIDFIKTLEDKRILWITATPYAPLLSRKNCLPIARLKSHPVYTAALIQDGNFDQFIVSRLYKRGQDNSFDLIDQSHELDEETFVLKELRTEKLGMNLVLKLEEIVDIRLPVENEPSLDPAP
jgi:4-amino-4-deoxy-L-arabinose transferase-like glycosyltransferase